MPNQEIIPLAALIAKLGVMLALALMVERLLAMIKWFMDRLFIVGSTAERQRVQEAQAQIAITERAAEEAHLLAHEQPDDPQAAGDPREVEPNPSRAHITLESRFDVRKILPPEELDDPDARFEATNRQRRTIKEFWLQVLGASIAIAGCWYMEFSIWVFVTWIGEGGALADIESQTWEFLFTGLIIGAGSKPVNFLMNFLVNRKFEVSRAEVREEARKPTPTEEPEKPAPKPPPPTPITPKSIQEIVGFEYDGGVRPHRLQHTHLYPAPIDLIVFHHTAMNSESPFEEVIKEFDRKGWLTGYHCVIMKDGTIRILCRWDRFANHAKGYNAHSMGVALHGNFETNPKVPFSNHDGRFGILSPTTAQVDSAARVVALWALMHNVDVKFRKKEDAAFPNGIIPHRLLAPKACPGGNFPYSRFESLVKDYANTWKQDDAFTRALGDFKGMPRVTA